MDKNAKIALLGGLIVVALAVVVVMVLKSSPESGSIDPTPKQMKPSARSKH